MNRGLPIAIAALVAALGGFRAAHAQPTDALDWRDAPNALGLELEANATQGSALFRWRLAPASGEPILCRLDADGDGRFDHVVRDCGGQKEIRHVYRRSGVYFATIVAESRDGRAGIARAAIAVAAE